MWLPATLQEVCVCALVAICLAVRGCYVSPLEPLGRLTASVMPAAARMVRVQPGRTLQVPTHTRYSGSISICARNVIIY
jgi:hypothetical protein